MDLKGGTVDAQRAENNDIIVVVTGIHSLFFICLLKFEQKNLSGNFTPQWCNHETRPFIQTFYLAHQPATTKVK